MKATDAALLELARKAGVRPPHIFHLIHYRAAMKDSFSAEGFAAFAMMDIKHVNAMLEVLGEPVQRKTRAPREASARTALPDGFTVPNEWLLAARDARFWTLDVCETEAKKFVLHHQAKGSTMANWKAAWLTWVNAPWKENGSASQVSGQFDSEEARKAYLEKLR